MFVTDNIYDFAINLVLPNFSFLGIDQNVSSTFDPNGVTEARRELDKDSLLVR
jgi:hypothetical protein